MANPSVLPAKPSMAPVLLTAFIDMVGIGIIFPVVAPLIVRDTGGMVTALSIADRKILYGFLIASYPLAQFFGAPLLGALSDRHGRKPVIMVSLLGGLLAYTGFALGIELGMLWLLFAARIMAGFFSGNISIVYSAVAELSAPEARARNFGMIGMMAGLGFILGPALGGILANKDLVSWFGPSIAFWASGFLCLLNIVLLRFLMKETLAKRSTASMHLLTGVRNIVKAIKMPGMSVMFIVVTLSTLGFAFFTQFFNVYMIEKFDFTDTDLAWVFSFIGVCIAIVQGGLMRPLSKIVKPEQVLKFSYLGLGIALACLVLLGEVWMIYAMIPLIAITHGLSYPNLSSLVSNRAPMTQQGEIMGINQSLGALGNAVPPIFAGVMSGIDNRLPIFSAGIVTLLAWLAFVLFFKGGTRGDENKA
jgi:DHA1 family tetracycline resistance protein-like MFS transporter